MVEKDTIYSSSMGFRGILNFSDFYKFCHEWLTQETDLELAEKKYKEKIAGDSKELDIEWECYKKLTDYFKFTLKVKFEVKQLQDIEINQDGKKIKTNKGDVKVSVKGILERDYKGKFETSAFGKFLRSVYEKWVIPSRIDQFEDKVNSDSDEFLSQAKAYLDLTARK